MNSGHRSGIELLWLQSLQTLAQTSAGKKYINAISFNTAQTWIRKQGFTLPEEKDTYTAVKTLSEQMNAVFKDKIVFEAVQIGEAVRVAVKANADYNTVYVNALKKGFTVYSFNGMLFLTALKKMTGKEFRSTMVTFNGRQEIFDILPLEVGLRAVLSMKLSKGTIKISDQDAKELGLGIIDKTIVKNPKTSKSFTSLSYTASKLPKGTIMMSIADARTLSFTEGDKVTIEKAGGETGETEIAFNPLEESKND